MYLRRIKTENTHRYVIRESLWQDGCWISRDLLDLGMDPGRFVEYPGGNGYYFSPEVEEILQNKGVEYSTEDLEDVFLPFIEPHIRLIIERFRRGARQSSPWSGLPDDDLLTLQEGLHSFDKRRLHYLRCGRIDIGDLDGRPWKFLNVLLGKSRDEIEHTIEVMEQQLRAQELRSYLYTALHLDEYFPRHLTRYCPGALKPEAVDDAFLESLCRLNGDARFFKGVARDNPDALHSYLVKYVILYFDNDFDRGQRWAAYAERFGRQWHFAARVAPNSSLKTEEACKCLGICPDDLGQMSRTELTRRYRQQAKRLHPDKGGDHEDFIRMTDAYESLLLKK